MRLLMMNAGEQTRFIAKKVERVLDNVLHTS